MTGAELEFYDKLIGWVKWADQHRSDEGFHKANLDVFDKVSALYRKLFAETDSVTLLTAHALTETVFSLTNGIYWATRASARSDRMEALAQEVYGNDRARTESL